MDEDPGAAGGVEDASGQGHTGVCESGRCPSVVTGRIGAAYAFTGSERIRVAADPAFDAPSGFTVTAWIQVPILPSTRDCFAGKPLGSGGDNSWLGCVEPDGMMAHFAAGAFLRGGTIVPGTWHHVALVWDALDKLLYLDGTVVGTQARTISFDQNDVVLGADLDDGNTWTAAYVGRLDDVRIYDCVLDASAIAALAAP